MKTLAYYTAQLLENHACVIIPGIGGFVTRHQKAYIQGDTYYPPMRIVAFNGSLSHNDGLLCEALMSSEKISYIAATALLKRLIIEFREELNNKQQVVFGQIGTLSMNNNTICFIPYSPDFLPENLGLKPILLHKLTKTLPSTENISPVLRQENTLIIKLPTTKGNFLRYAAVFLLLFALSIFAPISDDRDVQNASFINFQESIDSYFYVKSTLKIMPAIDTVRISSEPEKNSAPIIAAQEIEEVVQKRRCHLIVASLRTEKEAQNYCETFPLKPGDTLRIISYSDSEQGVKYRVAINSYSTRSEAVLVMKNARDERLEMKNAWIWVQ